jgi:hypothetical protein
MAKRIFVSYRNGKISFLLMIVGVIGVVFEYSTLHSHLVPYAGDDTMTFVYVLLGTLALVSGSLAIILAIFRIPKWVWIMLSSLVLVFTILPPAILGGMLGFFPYVIGDIFTMPWIFMVGLPINPAVDFIGFWMAVGGALFSIISGISVPKK